MTKYTAWVTVVNQRGCDNRIEVTVEANNQRDAQALIQAQYGATCKDITLPCKVG